MLVKAQLLQKQYCLALQICEMILIICFLNIFDVAPTPFHIQNYVLQKSLRKSVLQDFRDSTELCRILQNSAEICVMSEYLGQCNSYSFIVVSISNIFQVLVDCDIAVGHTATQRPVLQKSTKTAWILQKFCRNCT